MKKIIALLLTSAVLTASIGVLANAADEITENEPARETEIVGAEEEAEAVATEISEKEKDKKEDKIKEEKESKKEKTKEEKEPKEEKTKEEKELKEEKIKEEKESEEEKNGKKFTKEELEAKKAEFKSIHQEVKDLIKVEKELFVNADPEARKAILADIAAVKKELRNHTIGVFINGKEVDFDQYDGVVPVIENERTLIPLRAVLEKYDATLLWNGEDQTITVTKGDIEIVMTIGECAAIVNGEEFTMDVAPVIRNERTLVPMRFISERFNMTVEWDEDSQTIIAEDIVEEDIAAEDTVEEE